MKIISNKEISKLLREHFKDSLFKDIDKQIDDTLNINRWILQINVLQRYVDVANKKIFEIGSGIGGMAILAKKYNFEYFGSEIDNFSYAISQKILPLNGVENNKILNVDGKNTQFPSSFFDVVTSTNVLEHCIDTESLICEGLRILKNNGYLIFSFPNYNSFYESHTGKIWIPYLSNMNPYLYYRICGFSKKKSKLLSSNEFQVFITIQKLKKILDKISKIYSFEIISYGEDLFKERIQDINSFTCWNTGNLQKLFKILQLLKKLNCIKIIGKICCITNTFTPVIIVLKKK